MNFEKFLNESAKRITAEILNEDPIFDKEQYELYRQVRDGDKKAIKNLKNKISTAAWEKRTKSDNNKKLKKEREKANAVFDDITNDIIKSLKHNPKKIVANTMNFLKNPGNADFHLDYEYDLGYGEEDEYLLSAEIPSEMSPIHKSFYTYFKIVQDTDFSKGSPQRFEDDRYVLRS